MRTIVRVVLTGLLVATPCLASPAQAQGQPGVLLATQSNNIVACNSDASNCFTVVDNGSGGGNIPSEASNPSVATNGTIAFDAIRSVDGTCVLGTQGICWPHVFLMDADGTNVRQITFNPDDVSHFSGDNKAAISPDGTMVAFISTRNAADDSTYRDEVYVVNTDGSGLTQLMLTRSLRIRTRPTTSA